jgi:Tfp pilus assembly PilM family ATPase
MSDRSGFQLARLFSSPPPRVGVELAARRVTVVALAGDGVAPAVAGHATEALPDGALVPSINAENVLDPTAVTAALKRCFERLAIRPRRVGLILPDPVAKVSLVRFERVPARAQDFAQLIRWQVRKTAPFRIEDAQVTHTPGVVLADGGREFVVSIARRDIVAEYERVCTSAGAHAGLVDLASFNLINAVIAAGDGVGDWLLVHSTPEYSTLGIVRGTQLIFYRSRGAEAEESLADLVHQTVMYHEDRLGGGGIPQVVLTGVAAAGRQHAEEVSRALESRLGVPVQSLDPRRAAALRDRIEADQALLDTLGSLVGMLVRGRTV